MQVEYAIKFNPPTGFPIYSLKFLPEPAETSDGCDKTGTGREKERRMRMKKSMAVFIVLAVLAAGGAAWAVDTNTLTVSASVTGTCKFQAPKTSTLDFGALDPSNPVLVNGSGTTQFWCTKGISTDVITANLGANPSGTTRRMAGPGGDFIPYSLVLTPIAGVNAGPTLPRTLNITGSVLAADYTGVSTGNYSDTVTLTINP
jgi:spore coat protein U-like protein